jgi:hypothetical protein
MMKSSKIAGPVLFAFGMISVAVLSDSYAVGIYLPESGQLPGRWAKGKPVYGSA